MSCLKKRMKNNRDHMRLKRSAHVSSIWQIHVQHYSGGRIQSHSVKLNSSLRCNHLLRETGKGEIQWQYKEEKSNKRKPGREERPQLLFSGSNSAASASLFCMKMWKYKIWGWGEVRRAIMQAVEVKPLLHLLDCLRVIYGSQFLDL